MTNESEVDPAYPLFPSLSEEGQKEAQQLIESFKTQLKEMAEKTIRDFYCEIMPYIESDSWGNYRNHIMAGMKDYGNRKIQAQYDFKTIRQAIWKLHREDIVADLNQDLVEENEKLKEDCKRLQERYAQSIRPY